MTVTRIIPLAFVVIAGPQILSAIFPVTRGAGRGISAALIGDAALSITAIVTVAFCVSDGASKQGVSGNALDIILMMLLVAAGVHMFSACKTSTPAKWMRELEEAKPKGSSTLGFPLRALFLTSFAVGGSVAGNHCSWLEVPPSCC